MFWKHLSKIVSPNFDKFETKFCLSELKQSLCQPEMLELLLNYGAGFLAPGGG